MKKALILMGSPKKRGNCAFLVEKFMQNFDGNCQMLELFANNPIQPCIDCDGCKHNLGCVIDDSFKKLLADDYDVLVIASPIYMSNLTPPMWNVISRFNFMFCNKTFLGRSLSFKEKKGVLILTGGGGASKKLMGKTNEELPIKQAEYIFDKLNARCEGVVLSLDTDNCPACRDEKATSKIIEIAKGQTFNK